MLGSCQFLTQADDPDETDSCLALSTLCLYYSLSLSLFLSLSLSLSLYIYIYNCSEWILKNAFAMKPFASKTFSTYRFIYIYILYLCNLHLMSPRLCLSSFLEMCIRIHISQTCWRLWHKNGWGIVSTSKSIHNAVGDDTAEKETVACRTRPNHLSSISRYVLYQDYKFTHQPPSGVFDILKKIQWCACLSFQSP